MQSERPLDPGQFVVDDVATGWTWTAKTEVTFCGGWAFTKDEAEQKAREVLDDD